MTALALKLTDIRHLQLANNPLLRAAAIGTAWGVALAAGLTAFQLYNCNAFCAADTLVTTTLSIVAGILTVGPTVVLNSRA